MVTIKKYRYFQKGAKYFVEEIEWGMAGTGSISLSDNRAVAIGESMMNPNTEMLQDLWIPISVGNPGCDMQSLMPVYSYKTENIMIEDGTIQQVQVPDRVIIPSPPMNIYSMPLKNGYVEITLQQYNIGIVGGQI